MAQTDNISTIVMPRTLVVLLVVFLALRVLSLFTEPAGASASAAAIPWTDVNLVDTTKPAENKLTLYEFRASWSEPCKRLEGKVFTNRQIAEMISNQFVPIQATDRLKEDGKNTRRLAELEKKYHVFALPTMVVVRPDGQEVATLVGSASALSTYHFLSRAMQLK